MRERWVVSCVLVALAAGGCEERPPPLTPRDGGRHDAGGAPGDGGETDAGPTDAAIGEDGAPADAAPAFDAGDGEPDAASPDAGPNGAMEAGLMVLDAAPHDGGPDLEPDGALDGCRLPDGGFDTCGCGLSSCTDDGDCRDGLVCASDPGCAVRRCTAAGAPCTSAADCAAGSECLSGRLGPYCARPGGGCHDTRDCPAGYACEAAACVDRRVACATGADCPFGFYCDAVASGGAPFCNRLARRCAGDHQCPLLASCRDVDGDGLGECVGLGECESNADCPAVGEVCGTSPELAASCGPYGACAADEDCAPSYACRDLFGDGVRACTSTSGECENTAECTEGICAPPTATEGARCIDGPLP